MTLKTSTDTVSSHTVLIISDQQENVAVWSDLFRQRDCTVLSEGNVSDALQRARLVNPSLMLVDIKLSKSERASLLTGLHAASQGPVLMLLAASTVDEIVEVSHEGADECLAKPVRPAVLVAKAMTWLRHGLRSEHASLRQAAA